MRNQRDEPIHAAIVACTDTSASDQKLPVNECISVLEEAGLIPYN